MTVLRIIALVFMIISMLIFLERKINGDFENAIMFLGLAIMMTIIALG